MNTLIYFLVLSILPEKTPAQDNSTAAQNSAPQDISKWPKVMQPGLVIPAGSTIQVKAASSEQPLFVQNNGPRPIANANPSDYYQVTKAANLGANSNSAENNVSSALQDGSLMVRASELKASANCKGDQCKVEKDLDALSNSPYEPNAFARKTMAANPALVGRSGLPDNCGLKAASDNPMNPFASVFGGGGGGGFSSFSFGGSAPTCALQKAQEAAATAARQGRKVSSVFVIADFSGGGPQGKLWIVNMAGNTINAGVPNPMTISGGRGGYNTRAGSKGTPPGAHITRPYREPRGGNILNGIEMDGLEGRNRSTHGRGVLLHGWDPSSPTNGCIGIPGTLKTRRGSYPNMGGANYFDTLANGVLKDGGNIVYNYTPDIARNCR